MKKKIITAPIFYTVVFLAGGVYIISTTESATSQLDYLIMLHQVEILREHLLLHDQITK